MSDKRKLIIIITAIILAAVIAVSVTLIVLLQPKTVTPDNNDPSNNPSSNLPVKNGDFGIVGSEVTTFPKTATNWTRYGAPEGENSTTFKQLDDFEKAVMGIVDTADDQWNQVIEQVKAELTANGADVNSYDLTNPHQHKFLGQNDKHTNSNVYMIAAVNPTAAAIISDSVSVSATTSVKITIRYNASQLTDGATVMVQKHDSTPNSKEENRYAYQYNITKQDDEWHEIELYVFNRKTSTQYVRVSVGLGNVYTGENASGILYIDDIKYETVTADDYRKYADEAQDDDTTYKIIEKEEETTVPQNSGFLGLKDYNTEGTTVKPADYTTSEAYLEHEKFSPFTNKDDFFKKAEEGADRVASGFGIYKLANDGNIKTPLALELADTLKLELKDNYNDQDYQHVSFWVRTVTKENNALAYANVLIQRKNSDGEWENLSSGDFTVTTEQNIETDTNNGWSKYDIYLKPSQAVTEVRIVFALGNVNGYDNENGVIPNGELYVTTPYFETISISAYNSASSSTASKKFDLAGSTAETSVTNGSFSSVSANTKQPTGWTPVFAGDNAIYRDGQGNKPLIDLDDPKAAVAGSGVVDWRTELGADSGFKDDDEGRILKLVSNVKSSYGYVSGDITASAHTAYVFSVLAKADTTPYFYLLQSGVDRDKAILASVESRYSDENDPTKNVKDSFFCMNASSNYGDGWVRYYIVYVTGDKDVTVKLALFNGSLTDATNAAEAGTTVYYDKVAMQTLGSYSMVKDEENEDADKYVVKFAVDSNLADTEIAEFTDVKTLLDKAKKVLVNNAASSIEEPEQPEWDEMMKIPEPTDDDDDDEEPDTPTEKRDVNLALLFSILSSVLLVAALAVVLVLKIYRNKKRGA